MEKVFEIYIKTTPERLWEAITDPELRQRYTFGMVVDSDWTPGSRWQGSHPTAPDFLCEGENLEVDPPRRLIQSFTALWSDEVRREGESRVTWDIEPVGDSCRLTLTHDRLRDGAHPEVYGGWPQILSGENLEIEPPRRLVQSFDALWSDDVKAEGTSRVTWEIEPVADSCRLTVTHDQLREGANDELYGGWMMILSGLKTLLETGELLTTPGSLRYAQAGV